MHIMIHACLKRNEYVYTELIPSLLAQGIKHNEIHVWMDVGGDGNLVSCINSFRACGLLPGGTWHLQDDVIISRKFAETARAYDDGVICGFVSNFAGTDVDAKGFQPPEKMWLSFPCIHIPNRIAEEFGIWFLREGRNQAQLEHLVKSGKNDDYIFWQFMMQQHPNDKVLNMAPSMVDHIDYLIGGSVINSQRNGLFRAIYFEDADLVDAYEQKTKNGGN